MRPRITWLFVKALVRNEDGNGLPDDFLRRVAEEPFRRLVPARDHPVEVLADDGVVRGGNDRCQPLRMLLGAPSLASLRSRSVMSTLTPIIPRNSPLAESAASHRSAGHAIPRRRYESAPSD